MVSWPTFRNHHKKSGVSDWDGLFEEAGIHLVHHRG